MSCPYVRGDTTQYCTLNCNHGDLLAQLAAVNAAIDQYHESVSLGAETLNALAVCVTTIAKAVGR